MRRPIRSANSPRVATVVLVILTCATACSSASATPSARSQLRRAFGQVFVAAADGDVSTCSDATPRGRLWLTEIMLGQEQYLPSTSCQEAIGGIAARAKPTNCATPIAAQLKPFIQTAVIHVKGDRATVQLTDDVSCEEAHGEEQEHSITGRSAVMLDAMSTTQWLRRHGRWLLNDAPTGTYSAEGRKSAAMLRAALSGGTISETVVGLAPNHNGNGAAFCANGSTHISFFDNYIPDGGKWYVAGGYSVVTHAPGPSFDAQGNPQGVVVVYTPTYIEWGLKLIGGTVIPSQPPSDPFPLLFQPGTAGC